MTKGWGRVSLVLTGACLSGSLLAGCGSGVPIAFHRVVSPCIEMPKVMGLDGKAALERMLEMDFNNKDADANGELTLDEAKKSGTMPDLVDADLFGRLDTDKKGKLGLEQVKAGAATLFKWAGYYKLKLLIRFDKSGDRYLTWDELKGTGDAGYFGIDAAKFGEADDNKDQKLDPDEFLNLVLTRNADTCGGVVAPPPEPAASPAATTGASSVRRGYPPAPPVYRPAPPIYRRYQ